MPFRELSLVYTLKCNISCAHCAFYCSPRRAEKMPFGEACTYIDTFCASGADKVIGITGGEVFLYFDEVERLVRYINCRGAHPIVVSNGFWAKTFEEAMRYLTPLKNAGLKRLDISVDDFHVPFIDMNNYCNIIIACAELDIPILFKIVTYKDCAIRKDTLLDILGLEKVSKRTNKFCNIEITEGTLVSVGRGRQFPTSRQDVRRLDAPCDLINEIVCVTPSGDCYACCGMGGPRFSDINLVCDQLPEEDRFNSPVYLGNVDSVSFSSMLEMSDYRLLNILIKKIGPLKILELASKIDGRVLIADSYNGLCDICMSLVTVPENKKAVSSLLQYIRHNGNEVFL